MECENKKGFPFDYKELSPEENEELLNYYTRGFMTEFVRLGSKGYFFFKEMTSVAVDVYNMEVRPSDTFVITFPRSGTTWTQELVWLIQNDLDFEKAKALPLPRRFPYVEYAGFLNLNIPKSHAVDKGDNVMKDSAPENLKTAPSPRFIKSHMPLSLLPPSLLETAKVVYVARDPRDVAVSHFYHLKTYQMIPNDTKFKSIWNMFLDDKIFRSPFFEHVKEAWQLRNDPNLTFIFYEELSKDLVGVAKRLAKFFGKEYSDEQYEALHNHLKFDNFKNNKSVNNAHLGEGKPEMYHFIRKGKTGGWRNYFDQEMTEQAERWIVDNLRNTDLRFPTVE